MSRFSDEVGDLFGSLAPPFRALGITLAGMWLAWRWLAGDYFLPACVVTGVVLAAYVADGIGRLLLPNRPRGALTLLEGWIAAPLALGAAASAALVVLSVRLWLPEGTPVENKELIGTLTSGLTTFLTSVFISWVGDQDDSRFAERIKRAFFSKYTRYDPQVSRSPRVKYFRAESLGEQLVNSEAVVGVEGWGRNARRTRASELAKQLKNRESDA